MTIYVIPATAPPYWHTEPLTFKGIQTLVGGYVQLIEPPAVDSIGREIRAQVCCNEDGITLQLPYNARATEMFSGVVALPPAPIGARGTWIILTGKDLIE